MIRNYITVAFRHLWRRKGYTFLNVAGLAVGIAACAFMLLYIRHELSYDRFNEYADRTYRLATQVERDGRTQGEAFVHMPVVSKLGEIPDIEAMSLVGGSGRYLARRNTDMFYVEDIATADENVFDVFDFELSRGNPGTALKDPYTLVVTPTLGRRLFGATDPMGQTISLSNNDYTITGILEPIPSTSHWQFEGLRSWSTNRAGMGQFYDRIMASWNTNATVYVRLPEGTSPDMVESKLNAVIADVRPDNSDPTYSMFFQPITDIHLYSNLEGELGPPGDVATLYVFGSIAALILLIACINYMNLATARSVRRAREIGVRKVVGAARRQLIGQLLGESLLTSLIAAGLAAVLLEISLPFLDTLVGRDLAVHFFREPMLAGGLLLLALFIGLAAGSYPAFFMSSSSPSQALKGGGLSLRHAGLRRALVVIQFTVSIAFIAGTGMIRDQLNFIRNTDLGFDRDHIISITRSGGTQTMYEKYPVIKQELERLANVESVTASMGEPGIWAPENTFDPDADGAQESLQYNWLATDFDFLETFDIDLVAGRDLDPNRPADSTAAFLINETAARALGLDDPIGHELKLELNDRTGTIVGLVKDFHHASLREKIEPTLMYVTEPYFYGNVFVKVNGDDLPATLTAIESTWKSFFPDQPVEYAFYDDEFNAQYVEERRTARIAGLVAMLAVFVACLGLFGLASFAAEQRTKEIGIRKVLGASVSGIVGLLSKDFLLLVCAAFVVAAPLTWIAMSRWLDGFAYHISPGVGTLLGAAAIALVIALATVSGQAIRAALSNPVTALRNE